MAALDDAPAHPGSPGSSFSSSAGPDLFGHRTESGPALADADRFALSASGMDPLLVGFLCALGRAPAATTVRTYASIWSGYLEHLRERGLHPEQARPEDVRAFLMDVEGKRSARSTEGTRRRYLELLCRVYEAARTRGTLDSNPAWSLFAEFPKPDSTPPSVLPQTVEEDLIGAVCTHAADVSGSRWKTVRNRAALMLALGSGLKSAELVSLTLAQVVDMPDDPSELELATPYLMLPESRPLAARATPISPSARGVLHDWLRLRADGRIPGELVFPVDLAGTPMHPATLYRIVHGLLERSGIAQHQRENLLQSGPALLRNSFAVRQLRAGTGTQHVGRWLGLRDPNGTGRFEAALAYPDGVKIV
jgi:site-specific recombinase XerD